MMCSHGRALSQCQACKKGAQLQTSYDTSTSPSGLSPAKKIARDLSGSREEDLNHAVRSPLAQDYVGREVAKSFGALGTFRGTVTRYDGRTRFFRVVYEDGDEEDFILDELTQLLAGTGGDAAQRAGGRRACSPEPLPAPRPAPGPGGAGTGDAGPGNAGRAPERGDLAWVLVPGFPWWPALGVDDSDVPAGARPVRARLPPARAGRDIVAAGGVSGGGERGSFRGRREKVFPGEEGGGRGRL